MNIRIFVSRFHYFSSPTVPNHCQSFFFFFFSFCYFFLFFLTVPTERVPNTVIR